MFHASLKRIRQRVVVVDIALGEDKLLNYSWKGVPSKGVGAEGGGELFGVGRSKKMWEGKEGEFSRLVVDCRWKGIKNTSV